MFYRWICLLVMLLCIAGCNRKTVVKANNKTAEEWSKVLQTGKTDDRTKALDLISKICAADPTQVPFLAVGLKHDDVNTRLITIRFLKDLGPKASMAAPDLQALLANEAEEKHIKKEAEEALVVIVPGGVGIPGADAPAVPASPPAPMK